MNINFQWDDENVKLAAKLWSEGRSQTQIGTAMGISRNAVAAMIYRHRALFPSRTRGVSIKQATDRPAFKGQQKHAFHWNETLLTQAGKMWKEGKRAADIAAHLGIKLASFHSATARYREYFPNRQRRDVKPVRNNDVVHEFVEDQAAERYDLTRYQIAGLAPTLFKDLGSRQCRFPLEAFDAVSGPKTPCCGHHTPDLESYCPTHRRIMGIPAKPRKSNR